MTLRFLPQLTAALLALTTVFAAVPSARATINTTASQSTLACDGANTGFSFSFPAVNSGDISVIVTDSSGIETTLTTSLYTLALNAAPTGQIWGLGGTVTYPLSGGPCPTGSLLTITRTLPLKQSVSLSNQGNVVPKTIEQGLDLLAMQVQQIDTQIGKQITVAASDSPPAALPPAAQRANQALVFDASGNPIAGAIPSSGVISSVMQPVVGASSLTVARDSFGLGNSATGTPIALSNIGTGLQDDGSGAVRVNFPLSAVATDQAPVAADHLKRYAVTGAKTFTLPRANTVWAGYEIWVYALTANVTVVPNANDAIGSGASGASLVVPAFGVLRITGNAASSGTWYAELTLPAAQNSASTAMVNGTLSTSVASNALTVSIKTALGNDPSPNDPVFALFRNATLTGGDYTVRVITGALSFTVAATNTMGCSSAAPCRLWAELIDNGGTVLIGLSNQSTATQCYPLNEGVLQTTGSGTGGGSSAGTIYTSVSAVASKPIRIVGYLEWTSITTAGTWTAPDIKQLFGPGINKPCSIVQTVIGTASTPTTINSTANTATNLTATITPTSAANRVRVDATGTINGGSAASALLIIRIYRTTGTTAIGSTNPVAFDVAQPILTLTRNIAFDSPNATAATQYGVYGKGSNTDPWIFLGTAGFTGTPAQTGIMILDEIMGALTPDNDNGLMPLALVG